MSFYNVPPFKTLFIGKVSENKGPAEVHRHSFYVFKSVLMFL